MISSKSVPNSKDSHKKLCFEALDLFKKNINRFNNEEDYKNLISFVENTTIDDDSENLSNNSNYSIILNS